MEKKRYLEIYRGAHNNAVELLVDAEILFSKKRFPRAYFLAFTALEEISKSQYAADVFTGLVKEKTFNAFFRSHREKMDRMQWAHLDANEFPHNEIWLGPDIDDIERIAPAEPLWEKRQNSLYIDIGEEKVIVPEDNIAEQDAKEILHIVHTALERIWEVSEFAGEQIGTKGFMK